jgi:hypothetical protein
MTGLRPEHSGNCGMILCRSKVSSRLHILETSSEAHLSSCAVDNRGFSPVVKWWLRETDQSTPSSTEVKNE